MISKSTGKVALAVLCSFAFMHHASGAELCGELGNAYGPYDYWSDKDKLGIVERAHFTPEVESLKAGKSSTLGGDIAYTLRAFPNHPRALLAMVRLGERLKVDRPPGSQYTVACFLDRAVRFRPDDAMARMIYGTYLAKRKKNELALEHLEIAEKNATDNANVHYNLGLVYSDLGKYDQALSHAHAAYRLGFNLPGLRDKLVRAGKWKDPEPEVVKPELPASEQPAAATGGQ
jgi:tetratricopeptide (TPR) repeat protein